MRAHNCFSVESLRLAENSFYTKSKICTCSYLYKCYIIAIRCTYNWVFVDVALLYDCIIEIYVPYKRSTAYNPVREKSLPIEVLYM